MLSKQHLSLKGEEAGLLIPQEAVQANEVWLPVFEIARPEVKQTTDLGTLLIACYITTVKLFFLID